MAIQAGVQVNTGCLVKFGMKGMAIQFAKTMLLKT
jgi:hypothetical protein